MNIRRKISLKIRKAISFTWLNSRVLLAYYSVVAVLLILLRYLLQEILPLRHKVLATIGNDADKLLVLIAAHALILAILLEHGIQQPDSSRVTDAKLAYIVSGVLLYAAAFFVIEHEFLLVGAVVFITLPMLLAIDEGKADRWTNSDEDDKTTR